MDMPEIRRCMFLFPPRYACVLISLGGMGIGGAGLAGIIFYGLVEKSIGKDVAPANPMVKKALLASVGLTSLLLLVANVMLFLGSSAGSRALVSTAKWILLLIIMILLTLCAAGPLSCFFLDTVCVIKNMSTAGMVAAYLFMYLFITSWLYCMVVVYNYEIML